MSGTKTGFFKFDGYTIGFPLLFVLTIWGVYWAEIRFGLFLNPYGVAPKSLVGLRGVLLSPFIHGSIEHLYSNTIPLYVLSLALFYFYRNIALRLLLWGTLLSGLLTWGIGEEHSVHIGASGVIYLMASFLFFKGIWSRHYRLMALSLIVVFLYGGFVWGMLPGKEGISWEGHLAGFVGGIILALIYRKYQLPQKKYQWEEDSYKEEDDEFMQHFDKDGNFVPSPSPEMEDTAEIPEKWGIKYEYKTDKEKKEE